MENQIALSVKCPHCDRSLMDEEHPINGKPSIKMNIETDRNRGVIWLCSLYGCHDHENNIELRNNELVQFYCPKCNKSLMRDIKCQVCDAPMVGMNIKIGGKVNICSRKGCENHYVVFDDLAGAINKFYYEFGFSG